MFAHMCMSVSVFGNNYIISIKTIPYNSYSYMHNFAFKWRFAGKPMVARLK